MNFRLTTHKFFCVSIHKKDVFMSTLDGQLRLFLYNVRSQKQVKFLG